VSDEQDASSQQGCGLTPGIIAAIAVAFFWMMFVVPLYQQWRYGPKKPAGGEPAPAAESPPEVSPARPAPDEQVRQAVSRELAARAEELRAEARRLREAGSAAEAAALEKAAERLSPDRAARGPSGRESGDAAKAALGVPGAAAAQDLAAKASAAGPSPREAAPTRPEEAPREIDVEAGEFAFTFSTRGASIKKASLRNYRFAPRDDSPLELLLPLAGPEAASFVLRAVSFPGEPVDLAGCVWELAAHTCVFGDEGGEQLVFRTVRNGIELTKTYTLRGRGFVFELAVEARNASAEEIDGLKLDLVGPNGIAPDETARFAAIGSFPITARLAGRSSPGSGIQVKSVGFAQANSQDPVGRSLSKGAGGVNEWAAVKNRYFAAILQAEEPGVVESLFAEAVEPKAYKGHPRFDQPNIAVAARLRLGALQPGARAGGRFAVYLGPMRDDVLSEAGGGRGWDSLIDYGWFAWLSKLLLILLNALHFLTRFLGSIVGGYGLAILLLTLAVKAAMHPLQRKAMISMHRMQELAPEMQAIRKRYEKDKSREAQRKMQLEIMELYKKHGVSPMGGCLPMLVQLPMFFALYGMLRGAFELRHARYLWIADLSHPDEVLGFGFTIPLLNWSGLNLLPVIYATLFFVQQSFQPKSEDPQVRQTQTMMKFMGVFFSLIFYNMPSGLVLYFVFSNALGLLESWLIRRGLKAPAAAGGAPGSSTVAPPLTSWDRQDAEEARAAEKRRRREEKRGG